MAQTDLEQNLAVNPQEEMLLLRKRLLDLQKTGMLTPESFPTYQQTILQIWQETERRRMSCLEQAQTLRTQAMQAEAQSHAFSVMGSLLYAVINGYVVLENRRVADEQERARQKAAEEAEAAAEGEASKTANAPAETPGPAEAEEPPKTPGKRRKRDGDQQG